MKRVHIKDSSLEELEEAVTKIQEEIEERRKQINVGDKVIVKVNSYSVKVAEGRLKLSSCPGGMRNEKSPKYEVIDKNLILPSSNSLSDWYKPEEYNDTIIKGNGKMYFIQERFLEKVLEKDGSSDGIEAKWEY